MESGFSTKNRRSAVILVCVALLVLGAFLPVLSGCGGEKAENAVDNGETNGELEDTTGDTDDNTRDDEPVELGMEYTNDIWYFSVSFPEGWDCTETMEGAGCSIKDPDKENWEVTAWCEPALEKTPGDWLAMHYTMQSSVFETEIEEGTMEVGTIDGEDYVYDYWTRYVPIYEGDVYYEVFVVERDNKMFIVTAEYPVDEVEEAEPVMMAIMDSFTLPGREAK